MGPDTPDGIAITWVTAWMIYISIGVGLGTLNLILTSVVGRWERARQWWEERWLPHIREQEQKEQIAALLHQFENNNGETLRDQVDQLTALLTAHIEASLEHIGRLSQLETDVRQFIDTHGERHQEEGGDE